MEFKRSSVRSRYPPLRNPLQNKGLCRFLRVPHWWVMGLALLLHHICTTFRQQFHVSYMFDRWDITNQIWCRPESLMVASWASPPCDRALVVNFRNNVTVARQGMVRYAPPSK